MVNHREGLCLIKISLDSSRNSRSITLISYIWYDMRTTLFPAMGFSMALALGAPEFHGNHLCQELNLSPSPVLQAQDQ